MKVDPLGGLLLGLFAATALLGYGWMSTRARSARGRLKCVDPLAISLALTRTNRTKIVILAHLTCYVYSENADPAWIQYARVRLKLASGEYTVDWTRAGDIDGVEYPLTAGFGVTKDSMVHALLEFASADGVLIEALRVPGTTVRMVIECRTRTSNDYHPYAYATFITQETLSLGGRWSAASVKPSRRVRL